MNFIFLSGKYKGSDVSSCEIPCYGWCIAACSVYMQTHRLRYVSDEVCRIKKESGWSENGVREEHFVVLTRI